MELGRTYISKIDDDDYFEKLLLDVDFQNRSVMKIIVTSRLQALFEDGKVDTLIANIYNGKEYVQCDGDIRGFSTFAYILMQKPFKLDS